MHYIGTMASQICIGYDDFRRIYYVQADLVAVSV